MDFLLLIVLLLVLFVPYILMMRKQSAARKTVESFQASLTPGARVVTAGGFHATVVAVRETELDVEIAPGVTATVERTAVIRPESDAAASTAAADTTASEDYPPLNEDGDDAQGDVQGGAQR